MVSPDAGAGGPAISELEWNRMLTRIEDRNVIPVVGEHLTVMSRGDPPREMSLAAFLATELGLVGQAEALAAPLSLNDLAFRYLELKRGSLDDDLYADIFQTLVSASAAPVPTPLRQLAEIRHFELFVTTSFDPYLAMALNEVRFGRRSSRSTRVLSYERNRQVDIPENYRNLDYPLVYHLFGKAQGSPLFAVTDEDVLEFVHTLQAPEYQPPNLSGALREQRLLVLGTRLTGWLARFFLRGSSKSRLRDARRGDYLVDPTAKSDLDQTLFFERFGQVKLLPMPTARFVDELNRRWKARHPDLVASSAPTRTSIAAAGREVFLSYASEDRDVVKVLRERLEREAGVSVWLDKEELRGGDQWERKIADALASCAVIVPVISASTKSGSYRFVRAEWKQALKLKEGNLPNKNFIIPLAIDDTRADDPDIDPDIRALHWRRLQDGNDMQRFVAEVRSAVEG
jgi:hypothetical protein